MTPADTDQDADRDATTAEVFTRACGEVANGLANETARLDDARVDLDYFEGRGEQYIERRPAEDELSFQTRPKRCSGITTRVVEILATHLYAPGPGRHWDQEAGVREWLDTAYGGAGVDLAFQQADKLSTLSGVALLQVGASGDPADPIRLQAWHASDCAVFTDPDDATRPLVVVTIERCDETAKLTVYSADRIAVYQTKKLLPGQTAGGRSAYLQADRKNPYGILPFVVVNYGYQSGFWCSGPGTAIARANQVVDTALSNLGQAVELHLNPVGIATNVKESFAPVIRPGGFLRLPAGAASIEGGKNNEPKFEYLKAVIDVSGAWTDLTNFLGHTLECAGVPEGAIRLRQTGTASGFALVAEQAPLLARARQRQPLAGRWERALARVILTVGGSYYNRADLAAAAADPRLSLSWSAPDLALPGPELDARDENELAMGLASRVDLVMRRRGVTRDQAVLLLEQIDADAARFPTPTPITKAAAAVPTESPAPVAATQSETA